MYIMKSDKTLDVPRYTKLLQPVFSAIKELGGSARNDEILNRVIKSGRHTIDYFPEIKSSEWLGTVFRSNFWKAFSGRLFKLIS